MALIVELLPLLLFLGLYKAAGIFWATAGAILASLGQVAFGWKKTGTLDPVASLTLGVIVAFGGATLLFHDPSFIKMKPSALYLLFALLIVGLEWLRGVNVIRVLMKGAIEAPPRIWAIVNRAWAVFFCFLAALNVYVANHFSTDTWVNFKVFGVMGAIMVFSLGTSIVLARPRD